MSIKKTVTYTAEPTDRLRRFYTLQEIKDFAEQLGRIADDFDPRLVYVRLDGALQITAVGDVEDLP